MAFMGEVRIEAPSAEARATMQTPRVTTRNYLSSQHLWMARHSADRCAALEEALTGSGVAIHPEHAGYAVAAITLSVAFLEGLLNELFEDAQTRAHRVETLSEETARVMAEFWENGERYIGTLDKYQLALVFNGADRFDRGAEPFQSTATLIALRNDPSSRTVGKADPFCVSCTATASEFRFKLYIPRSLSVGRCVGSRGDRLTLVAPSSNNW